MGIKSAGPEMYKRFGVDSPVLPPNRVKIARTPAMTAGTNPAPNKKMARLKRSDSGSKP